MLIVALNHRLSDLTPDVQRVFVGYHASEVLKQIVAARRDLGVEYGMAMENHFNLVASDYFACRIDNPVFAQFLQEPRHLKYLVWLLGSVENPHLDQEDSDAVYAANKELIDQYLIAEFRKTLVTSNPDLDQMAAGIDEATAAINSDASPEPTFTAS